MMVAEKDFVNMMLLSIVCVLYVGVVGVVVVKDKDYRYIRNSLYVSGARGTVLTQNLSLVVCVRGDNELKLIYIVVSFYYIY